ncbi:EF-P beta-lysylation protein EpmB [Dokdonella koreensis]|uniref:L-lysine 2,3-aminomutase n=1 Tax=Dokdonella koreensis DS-123 TaxID=1300342 RepID=A0A160DWB7_9GAMM|nr:EF-P beta-lysylation protein EpmB [Dokdonella koreensis]ANB18163.1 Lysyl-lysine 2,3-aminomutase [Dokdonella koreensis DS-123]
MITANRAAAQPRRWQQLWREAVSDPHELLRRLDLAHRAGDLLPAADTGFPLRVPAGFIDRMRRGDARDPLLLQVLPLAAELGEVPGFTRDAVGDLAARAAHGVLHKYEGRALLLATGACAVHCRYCFRRHFPYAEETAAANRWQDAVAHLAGDPSIDEVILSGGDPLSLATHKLAELGDALAPIAHLRRLRIHTRLPVVLPERVDTEFTAWLASLPFQRVVVLHANHANEIDASVASACAALRETGATVLNQAVLLRGINDDADTLAELSERLFAAGVLPYYLHQLDRVAGAAHFEVPDATALALVETLRNRLPGYLVPRLVREIAGAPSKRPV